MNRAGKGIPLSEAGNGFYRVEGICPDVNGTDPFFARRGIFGFETGARLEVIRSGRSALIVRGACGRFAIGRGIAAGIKVSPLRGAE